MGTIIDSLVVTLGLDAKGFRRGEKQAEQSLGDLRSNAKRTATALDTHGKQGAQFFSRLTLAALGFFGVMKGADEFAAFAKREIDTAAATGRLAHNLGMSTAHLSAWGLAARQFAGGSAEAAQSSIANLATALQRFKLTGDPGPLNILSRLGINPQGIKTTSQLLLALSGAMHKMRPQQAMVVGQMLGLDPGMVNLLEQGRGTVQGYLREVRKEGVVTGDTARKLTSLQTAMRGVEIEAEAAGRAFLIDLIPALKAIAEDLKPFLAFVKFAGKNLDNPFKIIGKAQKAGGKLLHDEAVSAIHAGEKWWTRETTPGAAKMMKFFERAGYTPAQAAAIAGNAHAESSFNPKAFNPAAGGHYGLFQWDQKRREQIKAATGIDVAHATFRQQERAALWELRHTQQAANRRLLKHHSAFWGGVSFDKRFERSGDSPGAEGQRGSYAEAYAHRFAPSTTLPPRVDDVLAGYRAQETHHHTTTNETHIGTIQVHTTASDGKGIARSIRQAAASNDFAVQANTGLQ